MSGEKCTGTCDVCVSVLVSGHTDRGTGGGDQPVNRSFICTPLACILIELACVFYSVFATYTGCSSYGLTTGMQRLLWLKHM